MADAWAVTMAGAQPTVALGPRLVAVPHVLLATAPDALLAAAPGVAPVVPTDAAPVVPTGVGPTVLTGLAPVAALVGMWVLAGAAPAGVLAVGPAEMPQPA